MFTEGDFTPELRAKMKPFADEWIAERLRTDPADRAAVEDGIRRCYELAGIPWHGNVVWVKSPLVVCIAGPIAGHFLSNVAVDNAIGVAVRGAVNGAIDDAIDGAIGDAVCDAVHGAVNGAVNGAVGVAIDNAVNGAVDNAVSDAVNVAVDVAVDHAIDDAVNVAVNGAVGVAVNGEWWRYMSPWWSWDARSHFCVDVLGVTNKQTHTAAHRAASGAGYWWPHRQFVIVADRPTSITRERIGPDGWGSHQLHNDTGPAIAWGDEWAVWSWHGINVPQWVIDDPTVERIHAETNTEIRRCAIESHGWDRYLDHSGATLIDTADDPGNPGHTLELYAGGILGSLYDEPVRLLVMDNASLDRNGTRRRFAETVPDHIGSAIDAAAWQFDCDPDVYFQLERAT